MGLPMRPPDEDLGLLRERTTQVITLVVLDHSTPQVPIPGTSLTTMVYTLYSEHDAQAILNSRDHVDIKALVNGSGVLTLELTPADMVIANTKLQQERHRILFDWTYPTGREGHYVVRLTVANLEKVA